MDALHLQSAWGRDPNLQLMITRITRPGNPWIRITEEELHGGVGRGNTPPTNVGQASGGSCIDRDLIYNS